VSREIRLGRTEAYRALLKSIEGDESLTAKLLRKEYDQVIAANDHPDSNEPIDDVPGGALRRRAIAAARRRAFELLRDDVIGDDAYRVLVQELDWAELSAGGARAT
jgi:CPA1 family monovalent cation:H+ antiporter